MQVRCQGGQLQGSTYVLGVLGQMLSGCFWLEGTLGSIRSGL